MRINARKKIGVAIVVTQFMVLTWFFVEFRDCCKEAEDIRLTSVTNTGGAKRKHDIIKREPVAPLVKFSARKTAGLHSKNRTVIEYDNLDYLRTRAVITENARKTEIDDIFISVKTSGKFHSTRLQLLLETWVIMAREQTYFFTDTDDPVYQEKTNNHLINTGCTPMHNRRSLCCKMGSEYDYFIKSKKRWFCHVDDDTYLNVPQLVRVLQKYNHTGDWYLGKPSLQHPIQIVDKDNPKKMLSFWFATGGAGFCISSGLAKKMYPYAHDSNFKAVGDKIRLPDDCTIGYIITHQLQVDLTTIPTFHSHLEALWMIKKNDLSNQVTFSYSHPNGKSNVVDVPLLFPEEKDSTRFRSAHCHLYPEMHECPRRIR